MLALGAGPGDVARGQGGSRAEPRDPPIFEWGMPSRYGARLDARGGIVETQPYEVRPGPWTVFLKVVGPACARGATHRWSMGNGTELHPRWLSPCRFSIRFAREGPRTIRLKSTVRGRTLAEPQRVVVGDWLIVAIGDSVASGEGVPDKPSLLGRAAWQSARCHRSARAGVALAARQIEGDDGHSSVTFVHLACSGAEVPTGLLGPYAGAVPPPEEPPLEPQVSVLERTARERPVDALLISIGGNDVHFSEVASFCASTPARDCFARPLPRRFGGDGRRTVRESVASWLRELERRYDALARRIAGSVPASRVYITEYFDPTHDERGGPCNRILRSITTEEVEQARTRILAPLNEAIRAAANEHGWNLVDGIAPLFRTHGYCAGRRAWVSSLPDSLRDLGGELRQRHRGTLHPNAAGHEVIGAVVAAALERDLYPNRTFPPRPFPDPPSQGGSGGELGAFVAGLATSFLLGSLALLLALGGALGALLWQGREVGALILLGAGAGTAILFLVKDVPPRHYDPPPVLGPLVSLLRTARPLLLPLLVVAAVGTVKLGAVVQILAGAAFVLISWRLIVVPEAGKSGVELGWRRRLLAVVGIFGAAAIAIGALVVFLARGVWIDKAYFETIGDLASGLVLLAVLLWALAFVFRLFSFATTPLRAVLAFDIGLALTIGAMAIGFVPGDPDLADAWSPLLGLLAATALVLLAVDMALSALASEQRKTRRGITSRAAEIGLGAAAVSALVLAFSTGYGLIAAGERGGPLNPPEEEVVGARSLPPAALAGDGGVELARRYAPVLVFGEDERWAPIRVDSYVAGAKLSGPPGAPPEVDSLAQLATLPPCPPGERACYRLSIGCKSGDDPCSGGEFRSPGSIYRDGAVYVRVLEKPGPPGAPRGVFIDRGPYRDRLTTLLQYWFFYRYNEWRAPVFAGLLTQRHEADWEAVTIGLDPNRQPLFVANSAHCAGSWSPWRKVEASTQLSGPRIHPLVAVAEGSHANYPDPEGSRSPDLTSCKDAPEGLLTAISYASNIRDKTEYGWLWFPPADGWIGVTRKTPPMSFLGFWGDPGGITLRNFKTNPIGDPEDAPKTPTLQPLWREPVETIFCGPFRPRQCTGDGSR